MSIVRKKNYKTDVAVYSYDNFVDASEMFRRLTLDVPKGRTQYVRFGDRGVFFMFPRSAYINDADFYLVFISRTFVVWIHSDDGFAIMDVANPVSESIKKFIIDNPKIYMTKALHVQAEGEGVETQMKRLAFTTDFPSAIKVTGRVFDKKMNPKSNAVVTIMETGDTMTTDAKGNFSKTILLDGIKDIELSANFYMEADAAAKLSRFENGLFETVLKGEEDERTQLWKLETLGETVTGTAYVKTSAGYNGYPMKGKIMKNGQMNLTLDCSKTGIDFKCAQNFSGQIKQGRLTGKWSGTGGGGSFTADMNKYVATKRKVIITKDIADIKTYASAKGGYAPLNADYLNISTVRGGNALYIKPDLSRLGLSDIMTTGVKLVMTHLPKAQSGTLSVFAYEAEETGGKVETGRGHYAGQLLSAEEPYKAELDITEAMKNSGKVILNALPSGSGSHFFSGTAEQYDNLKPYFEITEYSENGKKTTEKPFTFFKTLKKDGDNLSDKNKPQKDGVQDVCFEGVFAFPRGRLTDFQLEITGTIKRIFNTNPVDIYPLVGFINDGILLNKKDGSIDLRLPEAPIRYAICVNGSYKPDKNERISYKYIMNGSTYEGLAE